MENALKVIIDTDIGDDIDDAFALLLAMKLNFEIVGITTVFENTDQRARITKKLLKSFGNGYENVPVYAGVKTPLAENVEDYPTPCQYTPDLDADEYRADSENEDDAIDFIINSCHKYGNELTVIALGPFTNIAKVIMRDREALTLVKDVVIMGGAYFKQYADWNVMCDVEAAKFMFENLSGIHCIGADVTHRLRLSLGDDARVSVYRGDDATGYVCKLYKLWKRSRGSIGVLHDPLAVYYALNRDICKMEEACVGLITSGIARGLTLNVDAYKRARMNTAYRDFNFERKQLVARDVDRDLMISTFLSCFTSK